jgi:uncharacterized membrane-anchored protein
MRTRLFVAAVVIQALVLLGWAADLEWALAGAPRIRLAVAQRDPRDLLRGTYVDLRFEIQEIPATMLTPGALPGPGDSIWVTLAPKGDVYGVVAASRTPPTLEPDQRVIAGRARWFSSAVSRPLHVEYGIEHYYVPETAGTVPRGKLEAEIALTRNGRPFLTRLFVDGRPYP